MNRDPGAPREVLRRPWGGARLRLTAVAGCCCGLAAAAARAADGGTAAGDSEVMALAGLSLAVVVALLVGLFFLHAHCVQIGARIAGLSAAAGQAYFTTLTLSLLLVPIGFALRALEDELSQAMVSLLTSALLLVAETVVIHWVYRATWSRSLLTFFCAAVLNNVAVSVLVLALF